MGSMAQPNTEQVSLDIHVDRGGSTIHDRIGRAECLVAWFDAGGVESRPRIVGRPGFEHAEYGGTIAEV